MGGGFLLRAGASTSLKSGIHAAWILAFARMTAGGDVMGGGFLLRAMRQRPYKSGISAAWILACARMTVGEGSKDDGWGCVMGGGFFHRRGDLPFLKNIKKPPQVYPATVFKR